jgi:hypothetical protein
MAPCSESRVLPRHYAAHPHVSHQKNLGLLPLDIGCAPMKFRNAALVLADHSFWRSHQHGFVRADVLQEINDDPFAAVATLAAWRIVGSPSSSHRASRTSSMETGALRPGGTAVSLTQSCSIQHFRRADGWRALTA